MTTPAGFSPFQPKPLPEPTAPYLDEIEPGAGATSGETSVTELETQEPGLTQADIKTASMGKAFTEGQAQFKKPEVEFGEGSYFKNRIAEIRTSRGIFRRIYDFFSGLSFKMLQNAESVLQKYPFAEKGQADQIDKLEWARHVCGEGDDWRFSLEEGRELLSRKKFTVALATLNNVSEYSHGTAELYYMKAVALRELGDIKQANMYFKKAYKEAGWLSEMEKMSQVAQQNLVAPVLKKVAEGNAKLSLTEQEILLQEKPNDPDVIHSLLESYLAEDTQDALVKWYALAKEKESVLRPEDKLKFGQCRALGLVESKNKKARLDRDREKSFGDGGEYLAKQLSSFDANQSWEAFKTFARIESYLSRNKSDHLKKEERIWNTRIEKERTVYYKNVHESAEKALQQAVKEGHHIAKQFESLRKTYINTDNKDPKNVLDLAQIMSKENLLYFGFLDKTNAKGAAQLFGELDTTQFSPETRFKYAVAMEKTNPDKAWQEFEKIQGSIKEANVHIALIKLDRSNYLELADHTDILASLKVALEEPSIKVAENLDPQIVEAAKNANPEAIRKIANECTAEGKISRALALYKLAADLNDPESIAKMQTYYQNECTAINNLNYERSDWPYPAYNSLILNKSDDSDMINRINANFSERLKHFNQKAIRYPLPKIAEAQEKELKIGEVDISHQKEICQHARRARDNNDQKEQKKAFLFLKELAIKIKAKGRQADPKNESLQEVAREIISLAKLSPEYAEKLEWLKFASQMTPFIGTKYFEPGYSTVGLYAKALAESPKPGEREEGLLLLTELYRNADVTLMDRSYEYYKGYTKQSYKTLLDIAKRADTLTDTDKNNAKSHWDFASRCYGYASFLNPEENEIYLGMFWLKSDNKKTDGAAILERRIKNTKDIQDKRDAVDALIAYYGSVGNDTSRDKWIAYKNSLK